MTASEPARLRADDGRELFATWFRPSDELRGAVVVAPAMGTRSSFYRSFAEFLADRGYLVLTFDYRGMERGADVRRVSGDVLTWATDAAVALEALHAELGHLGSDAPITWVGHSLGGQVLGFVDHSLVERAVVVATGHGYWRHNPASLRRWILLFWHVIVPISLRLFGYYPGRRLGFLVDLPRGVMLQWRRWCLHPRYWGADVPEIEVRHGHVTAPVSAIHLADDEILTTSGIRALLAQLVSATTDLQVVSPQDLGTDKVGHHGFFRARHVAAWEQYLLPLLANISLPVRERDVA